MSNERLDKALDRIETVLSQARSSLGNPRAAQFLNALVEIQRFVQDNPKTVKNLATLNIHIAKIHSIIGMEPSE